MVTRRKYNELQERVDMLEIRLLELEDQALNDKIAIEQERTAGIEKRVAFLEQQPVKEKVSPERVIDEWLNGKQE
jgi:hypothetical protein